MKWKWEHSLKCTLKDTLTAKIVGSVLNTLNEAEVLENNLKPGDEHLQPSHMVVPPGIFELKIDMRLIIASLLVLEAVVIYD